MGGASKGLEAGIDIGADVGGYLREFERLDPDAASAGV